jgi:putative sterol carrier protein
MSEQRIKAGINLYAILKNLEDLVAYDDQARMLVEDKNICIRFSVKNGPQAWVKFENGICQVGQGKPEKSNVTLFFTSCEHLNKMFDGNANPIPLKGFTKLGFLQKEFTELTKRLEYFLRPENVENPDDHYIKMNTLFTLTIAAFALPEIAQYDEKARYTASHLPDGSLQMSVLPDGPHVYLEISNHKIKAGKGSLGVPSAMMLMKNAKMANDFLNGKSDPFTAIAMGDVMIKGQIPILDGINLILDRVIHYVS